MAPFPETEIMTIKRLEVALRRMDFKLLKDGAYKLHEKFHSGYKFEYIDLLKDILAQTTNNTSIPEDIRDVLCPTIKDIISDKGVDFESSGKVSNLTSMSYNSSLREGGTAVREKTQENSISAFDVFSAPKHEQGMQSSNVTVPITQPSNVINEENSQNENQEIQDTPPQLKTISIYYGQDNSPEKIKNILKYKEMIAKFDDEHYSISQILKLISEINIQSDTNVSELKNILDQIKISGNKMNLITNSSSRELVDLFENEQYSYSLYDENELNQMTLIPAFGLSNQFMCLNCKEEYIDKNNPVKSLVIECPKCKSPMFPNFYAANKQNNQINMKYYNNALVSLANSKVWVLIHPSTEDTLFSNMLINAFKLNREIETVYILEKDINLREAFRREFALINNNVEINVQMTALEDFINSLR